MLVDVLSGPDIVGSLPDDLAKLEDTGSPGNGVDRHLVATLDPAFGTYGAAGDLFTWFENATGHNDIVVGMKLEGLD